jgi:hypothetical protein
MLGTIGHMKNMSGAIGSHAASESLIEFGEVDDGLYRSSAQSG